MFVSYQGYDYATVGLERVLIGEQLVFASWR